MTSWSEANEVVLKLGGIENAYNTIDAAFSSCKIKSSTKQQNQATAYLGQLYNNFKIDGGPSEARWAVIIRDNATVKARIAAAPVIAQYAPLFCVQRLRDTIQIARESNRRTAVNAFNAIFETLAGECKILPRDRSLVDGTTKLNLLSMQEKNYTCSILNDIRYVSGDKPTIQDWYNIHQLLTGFEIEIGKVYSFVLDILENQLATDEIQSQREACYEIMASYLCISPVYQVRILRSLFSSTYSQQIRQITVQIAIKKIIELHPSMKINILHQLGLTLGVNIDDTIHTPIYVSHSTCSSVLENIRCLSISSQLHNETSQRAFFFYTCLLENILSSVNSDIRVVRTKHRIRKEVKDSIPERLITQLLHILNKYTEAIRNFMCKNKGVIKPIDDGDFSDKIDVRLAQAISSFEKIESFFHKTDNTGLKLVIVILLLKIYGAHMGTGDKWAVKNGSFGRTIELALKLIELPEIVNSVDYYELLTLLAPQLKKSIGSEICSRLMYSGIIAKISVCDVPLSLAKAYIHESKRHMNKQSHSSNEDINKNLLWAVHLLNFHASTKVCYNNQSTNRIISNIKGKKPESSRVALEKDLFGMDVKVDDQEWMKMFNIKGVKSNEPHCDALRRKYLPKYISKIRSIQGPDSLWNKPEYLSYIDVPEYILNLEFTEPEVPMRPCNGEGGDPKKRTNLNTSFDDGDEQDISEENKSTASENTKKTQNIKQKKTKQIVGSYIPLARKRQNSSFQKDRTGCSITAKRSHKTHSYKKQLPVKIV